MTAFDKNNNRKRSREWRRKLYRAVPKPIADNFPEYARFVWIAARLIGDSQSLQHARAKSSIALSCIHADLTHNCVAVRQPNPYNAQDGIRNTDNLIGQ